MQWHRGWISRCSYGKNRIYLLGFLGLASKCLQLVTCSSVGLSQLRTCRCLGKMQWAWNEKLHSAGRYSSSAGCSQLPEKAGQGIWWVQSMWSFLSTHKPPPPLVHSGSEASRVHSMHSPHAACRAWRWPRLDCGVWGCCQHSAGTSERVHMNFRDLPMCTWKLWRNLAIAKTLHFREGWQEADKKLLYWQFSKNLRGNDNQGGVCSVWGLAMGFGSNRDFQPIKFCGPRTEVTTCFLLLCSSGTLGFLAFHWKF